METLIMSPFFQKLANLDVFRNKAIRHNKMAIRHMWQVANGLDNADTAGLIGMKCGAKCDVRPAISLSLSLLYSGLNNRQMWGKICYTRCLHL